LLNFLHAHRLASIPGLLSLLRAFGRRPRGCKHQALIRQLEFRINS
jgi:hypothetical protein